MNPFITHTSGQYEKPAVETVSSGTSGGTDMETLMERIEELLERMRNVEASVAHLVELRTVKDWYTTEELAQIVGKAEFTVREWCRLGRIRAEKRNSGRGKFHAWVVSHAELQRFQREGLLPVHRPDSPHSS